MVGVSHEGEKQRMSFNKDDGSKFESADFNVGRKLSDGYAIETVFTKRAVKPLHVRLREGAKDNYERVYYTHFAVPDPPDETDSAEDKAEAKADAARISRNRAAVGLLVLVLLLAVVDRFTPVRTPCEAFARRLMQAASASPPPPPAAAALSAAAAGPIGLGLLLVCLAAFFLCFGGRRDEDEGRGRAAARSPAASRASSPARAASPARRPSPARAPGPGRHDRGWGMQLRDGKEFHADGTGTNSWDDSHEYVR